MKQIWNVSPDPLILDMTRRAVQPAASTRVADDVAEELVAGPDWSYTNPRRPTKLAVITSEPPAEPEDKEQ